MDFIYSYLYPAIASVVGYSHAIYETCRRRKNTAHMEPHGARNLKLVYFINDIEYAILLKPHRGPRPIRRIVHILKDHEEDVTEQILPFMGHGHRPYQPIGVDLTPRDILLTDGDLRFELYNGQSVLVGNAEPLSKIYS